ncbi:MAG: DNA polymerase IV [Bacillus sp. (in: Bacteria)]|nr:DNA polymerase IV [Bacillus sp. (in: firmicutes)]
MNEYYPKNGRVILHIDMNSFFASIEIADHPELKGKPIAIAGDPKERKGVIVTCSYEAREYGVKTTMPVWEAKKLCPHLLIIQPHHDRYREASRDFFSILHQITPLVEPVSIDEGYVDITEEHHLGSPVQISKFIQQRIFSELSLPCSIGIAPNKFLAKMASDMKKPMGITILRKRDVANKLWPLPILDMHGIGKKTAEKLQSIHIFTIRDLAHANDIQLKQLLGIRGIQLKERANGIDARPVDPESINITKSIGRSRTFPEDIIEDHVIDVVLQNLAKETSLRLKRKGYLTANIMITIRYHNRKTITRSRKLHRPIQETEELFYEARSLFIQHWNGNPVRLLGVTGSDLVEEQQANEQLDLFTYEEIAKKEPLYKTISQLRDKFGENVIQTGRAIKQTSAKNKKK